MTTGACQPFNFVLVNGVFPNFIEIVPLARQTRARRLLRAPCLEEHHETALLILAALADGEVTLTGALWSRILPQIMVDSVCRNWDLRSASKNDPEEFCNRTITVIGLGGKISERGVAQ